MIRHCTGPCGSTFTDRADDFREEAAIALGICPVCSGLLRELETDDRAAQLLGDQHELAGDVVGDLAEALRLLELSHAREEDAARLERDRILFGNSFEIDGQRVDPRRVVLHRSGTFEVRDQGGARVFPPPPLVGKPREVVGELLADLGGDVDGNPVLADALARMDLLALATLRDLVAGLPTAGDVRRLFDPFAAAAHERAAQLVEESGGATAGPGCPMDCHAQPAFASLFAAHGEIEPGDACPACNASMVSDVAALAGYGVLAGRVRELVDGIAAGLDDLEVDPGAADVEELQAVLIHVERAGQELGTIAPPLPHLAKVRALGVAPADVARDRAALDGWIPLADQVVEADAAAGLALDPDRVREALESMRQGSAPPVVLPPDDSADRLRALGDDRTPVGLYWHPDAVDPATGRGGWAVEVADWTGHGETARAALTVAEERAGARGEA